MNRKKLKIEPRNSAIQSILHWRKKGHFLEMTLNEEFIKHPFSDQERRFIYELSFGTARNWNTIAYYAEHILQISIPKDELKKSILFVALYQRIFHTIQEKPYALVFEYVEIAKKLLSATDRFIGFLNSILRKSLLIPYEEKELIENENITDEERIAIQFSVSRDFVRKIVAQRGLEKSISILKAIQQKPPLFRRGNFCPQTMQFAIQPIEEGEALDVTNKGDPNLPLFYIQNRTQPKLIEKALSSLLPLLNTTSPLTILDLCSAPGGKALLVWNAFKALQIPIRKLILNEPNLFRQKMLNENRIRFQMESTVTSYDGTSFPIPEEQNELFDIILIDAPCSNSGLLFTCPEARYRITAKTIHEHQSLQKKLIARALQLLAPKGYIIYTTCSILSEENEALLQRVAENQGVFLLTTELILPTIDGYEGGFMGVLCRS